MDEPHAFDECENSNGCHVTNNGAGSMIWDDIKYMYFETFSGFFPLLPPSSLEELLL